MEKILNVLVAVTTLFFAQAAFAWVPGSQQCIDWLRERGSNHPDCKGTTLPQSVSFNYTAPITVKPRASADAAATAGVNVSTQTTGGEAPTYGGYAPTVGGSAPVQGGNLTEKISGTLKQEGNVAGQATLTGSGNGTGGGAQITDQSVQKTENKVLIFTPVAVAPLPQAMTVGTMRLEKVGECGPRYVVSPFTREHRVSGIFVSSEVKIPTAHGIAQGFDDKVPFIRKEMVLGQPFNETEVVLYGHQRYVSTEVVNITDGKSMAVNAITERLGAGGGTGNTSSTSVGVIGEYFVDCEFKKGTLKPPAPAKPEAKASDIMTVEETIVVAATRDRMVPNRRVSCKDAGVTCTKVQGQAGKMKTHSRTFSCSPPANAVDAKLCAERPPVGKEQKFETELK